MPFYDSRVFTSATATLGFEEIITNTSSNYDSTHWERVNASEILIISIILDLPISKNKLT